MFTRSQPHRELLVNTKAQNIRRWQYLSKNCVSEETQSCAAAVDKDTIKTLTDSMNNRLIKVMGAKGGYIHY